MIFITGVNGFVGQNLSKMLIQGGHEVLGLDLTEQNHNRLGKEAKLLNFKAGSTLDKNLLTSLFSEFDIQTVIHLGMISTPAQAAKNPDLAYQSIYEGTKSLHDLAIQSGCRKFIHFSSSHVYGNANREQLAEDMELNPKSLYGKIKNETESLLRESSKRSQMITHIVRPTSLYGPYDLGKRVVSLFIEKAINGETLLISDSTSKLDFTYIDDFLNGVEKLIFDGPATNEVFNLSRGRGRTLVELAEIIKSKIGTTKYEILEGEKLNNERTRKGQLDISKAKSILGYNPTIDLEEGVELILKAEGQR
jgi:nucleoside-diphosphate-sugar epimerase